MMSSAAFGLYPYLLPAITRSGTGLTVSNAAAPANGLWIALIWWIPGMLLATGYFFFVYRHFAGKVSTRGNAIY
jgi:cytochrome bd-type quinol oxidase subunit 2